LSPQCTKLTRKKLRKKLEKRGALTSNETDMLSALKNEGTFKDFYATK
ncbi:MAG: hypothetical protein JJE21_09975, partial [Spirochaetaceae bacterium]|nr:hypothetical protein [Spirochaetaceae bacterium]